MSRKCIKSIINKLITEEDSFRLKNIEKKRADIAILFKCCETFSGQKSKG